jgi:hypothetical protein
MGDTDNRARQLDVEDGFNAFDKELPGGTAKANPIGKTAFPKMQLVQRSTRRPDRRMSYLSIRSAGRPTRTSPPRRRNRSGWCRSGQSVRDGTCMRTTLR